MKADLKARVFIHNLARNYQCNMNLPYTWYHFLLTPSNRKISWSNRWCFFELYFPNYYPPRMCDRCLASQGKNTPVAMHYKNFSNQKAWDLTFIDCNGYLHLDRSNLTPWLEVPGFTMWTMSWDLLHNLWLGTARDLVASGIKTLVMQGCYDYLELPNIEDLLSYLDSQIRKTCSAFKFLGPI